ncbi:MAG: type II toxin-antitoxin system VapB family antitoxin [Methylococcaceae bacterium]
MRTNIVLDDTLVTQALALTGARSKKDVVDLALHQLVDSYKSKGLQKQFFTESYFDKPIRLKDFTPLSRDDIYER